MFKATDFKLIRRDCPEELKKLLKLLEIPPKNFDGSDEFELYDKLDKDIDKRFCERLNCKSDLDGYAKLLDLGGIKFDLSETRTSMLKKVLANRDKILSASLVYTQGLYIKITCNRAESFTDKIESSWQSKSIIPLIAPKEEINLSSSAQQKIKKFLLKNTI